MRYGKADMVRWPLLPPAARQSERPVRQSVDGWTWPIDGAVVVAARHERTPPTDRPEHAMSYRTQRLSHWRSAEVTVRRSRCRDQPRRSLLPPSLNLLCSTLADIFVFDQSAPSADEQQSTVCAACRQREHTVAHSVVHSTHAVTYPCAQWIRATKITVITMELFMATEKLCPKSYTNRIERRVMTPVYVTTFTNFCLTISSAYKYTLY